MSAPETSNQNPNARGKARRLSALGRDERANFLKLGRAPDQTAGPSVPQIPAFLRLALHRQGPPTHSRATDLAECRSRRSSGSMNQQQDDFHPRQQPNASDTHNLYPRGSVSVTS